MKTWVWILAVAAVAVLGYAIWTWRQRWLERQRASEERFAAFMAQARPAGAPLAAAAPSAAAAPKAADPDLPLQRLLLEAAAKAGEAGEPALSIQLYARLIARFPHSAAAAHARSAVEVQKGKLAKA